MRGKSPNDESLKGKKNRAQKNRYQKPQKYGRAEICITGTSKGKGGEHAKNQEKPWLELLVVKEKKKKKRRKRDRGGTRKKKHG